MTRVYCPRCRLRFAPEAASHLTACPTCGEPTQTADRAERMLGMRLYGEDELVDAMALAAEAALPIPTDRR
jgi:predicted RNA-binding Zn-ribbon protein involved in translation (DUF1610 family)